MFTNPLTRLLVGVAIAIPIVYLLFIVMSQLILVKEVNLEKGEQRVLTAITPQQQDSEVRTRQRSKPKRIDSAKKPPPPPKVSATKSNINLPTPQIEGAAPTELNLGRMQSLEPQTAARWAAMVRAAAAAGVQLMIVSGYRSIDYQARLIRKKINAGQQLGDILTVSAAPGYSEHHTGRAVDIATPGSRPLTEEFEDSAAFQWLKENAADFGFSMSYPRGNNYGFIYEPWHWAQHG